MRSIRDMWLWVLIGLILLGGSTFKMYKMHNAGITYDESFSLANFGQSYYAAFHSYVNPNNNHVINSILLNFAREHFSSYEHFIRIPSVVSGILFSFAVAYIVLKTIKTRLLQIAFVAWLSLHYFPFDLSLLARGYSYSLTSMFIGIAFIVHWLDKKIKYRHWLIPATVVSLMNFIAFGSMLSSLWPLVSINILFILLFSPYIFSDSRRRRGPILVNLISIPVFSGILTFAIYKNLYKDIIKAGRAWTQAPFVEHMKQLLIDTIVNFDTTFNTFVSRIFILIFAFSLLFALYQLAKQIKGLSLNTFLNGNSSRTFVFLTAVVTFLVMYVHGEVLKESIGYPRNSVFLLPFVLVAIGILFDITCRGLKHKLASQITQVTIAAVVLLVTIRTLPSPGAINSHNWDRQAVSGPLLRTLKTIDPERVWKIALTEETMYNTWPLYYYLQYGYKFQLVNPGPHDIRILYKTEKPLTGALLEKDYFDRFNCLIEVNSNLPPDKVFLDARAAK